MQKFFGFITLLAGIVSCIAGIAVASEGETGLAVLLIPLGFILIVVGYKVMKS